MPPIMATLSDEEMTKDLTAENGQDLVETFKRFESEQSQFALSDALVNVAKLQSTYLRLSLVLEQLLIPSRKKCHM